MATRAIQESISIGGQDSPLERAKRLVAPMCRQPKEAHWLGVRMENFLRAYGSRIAAIGVGDVCDYLEGLLRKGQVEWQVKQSLDAIGLLMKFGYQGQELSIPVLGESWGMRRNQRAGICVRIVHPAAADGVATVSERLRRRRVLRVAGDGNGDRSICFIHSANITWWAGVGACNK